MEVLISDRATFDEVLREIRKETKGTDEPLKIRIQPQTYHPTKGYLAWPSVAWTVRCQDIEEVKSFRKLLDEFFDAISRAKDVQQVVEALKGIAGE